MSGARTPPPILTGRGLVLRSWEVGDLPRMQQMFDDPQVAAWTRLESPFDAAAAAEYYARAQRRCTLGEASQWAVTEDGLTPIGEMLIFFTTLDHLGRDSAAELGYSLATEARGRGVATRAMHLVMEYGIRVHGLKHYFLRIDVGNHRSQAVAERCGFRPATVEPELQEVRGRLVTLGIWERAAEL